MPNITDFESLSSEQLRELAKQIGIQGAEKLKRQDVLRLLQDLLVFAAKPKIELIELLKEYEIKNLRERPKNQLALIALQASRYQKVEQAEFRRLALKAGIDLIELERKDVIKRLVVDFAKTLGISAMPVEGDATLLKAKGVSLHQLRSWVGKAVQVTCTVSVIVDIVGILLIPILAVRISSWLDERMVSAAQETTRLSDSIQQIDISLNNGVVVLGTAETTVRGIESTIEDTGPLIDSSASLIGEHAPQIIDNTRDALVVAEEGAHAIDQVLRDLSKISFLTGVSYAPEIPLDDAISEVTDSLEPLPEALRQVGDELNQTRSGIEDIGKILSTVSDDLDIFSAELGSMDETLIGMADDLQDLSEEINNARGKKGLVVLVVVIMFEFFLLGHVIGQAALYFVGRDIAIEEKG